MGWEDRVAVMAAEPAAGGVRADSEDPWAHLAMACLYVATGRPQTRWPNSSRRCAQLNPQLAQAYYSLVLANLGRWQEARVIARRSLQLSPRDPFSAIYSAIVAYAEFAGRNYHEAIRLARESLRQRPDFVAAHRVLTAAAAMAGETDAARAALQELRRTQPNISLAWIAAELRIMEDAAREHYLEAFRRAGLD